MHVRGVDAEREGEGELRGAREDRKERGEAAGMHISPRSREHAQGASAIESSCCCSAGVSVQSELSPSRAGVDVLRTGVAVSIAEQWGG